MRKLFSFVVLAAVSASMLAAFGCAESANKPYNLTGEQGLALDQQQWVDQHSIDQKGHFNPVLHDQALSQMKLANQGQSANQGGLR